MPSEWGRYCRLLVLLVVAMVACPRGISAQDLLPIGQIQGRDSASPHQDQPVRFRAIVTGILEDENSRGTRFYTVFAQDLPGAEDGDPSTSDGMAIFVGARRPSLSVGDIAIFSGTVTEFYGLTELDNNDLYYSIESRNNPLPEPSELDPPADNQESAAYLEQYEAMRVSLPLARVVGPSHVGCGFSVVRADAPVERIVINQADDPTGQIVGVLHPTDVDCTTMPDLAYGYEIEGLVGPLTFHFDRFKIVYQDVADLAIQAVLPQKLQARPALTEDQLLVATFNVENYFDAVDNTGDEAEPKPSPAEVSLKTAKLAATISDGLDCPTVIGLQEVETAALLDQLTAALANLCDIEYEISHLDSPDARGAESALLTDVGRFTIDLVSMRQTCTELETGVTDPDSSCPDGQHPLFSRPPLQIDATLDDKAFVFLVNHFKSKRDGAATTAPRRLAQAEHVQRLVDEIATANPETSIVVLGDFNDYDGSDVMATLAQDQTLVEALHAVPAEHRYSYIFDGASQLIDWILVSPNLMDQISEADILHINADYPFRLADETDETLLPYRSSDHDLPYIVIDLSPPDTSESSQAVPTAAPSEVGALTSRPTIAVLEPLQAVPTQIQSTPTLSTQTQLDVQPSRDVGTEAPKSDEPIARQLPSGTAAWIALAIVGGLFLALFVLRKKIRIRR